MDDCARCTHCVTFFLNLVWYSARAYIGAFRHIRQQQHRWLNDCAMCRAFLNLSVSRPALKDNSNVTTQETKWW